MARKPGPLSQTMSPGGPGKKGLPKPAPPRGGLNPSGPPPRHHKPPHHPQHHGGGGPLSQKMSPGGPGGAPPARKPPGGWAGKAPHHKKAKKHPKRKLAGTPLGGGWILGGNDVADNCAIVAAANALLAATGLRVPDAELLRIHDRAGPLSIAEALTAWGGTGGRESNPQAMLLSPVPGIPQPRQPSLVVGLATPHGPHAGLLLSEGLVTWGGLMALPDDWDVEEAWAVTW